MSMFKGSEIGNVIYDFSRSEHFTIHSIKVIKPKEFPENTIQKIWKVFKFFNKVFIMFICYVRNILLIFIIYSLKRNFILAFATCMCHRSILPFQLWMTFSLLLNLDVFLYFPARSKFIGNFWNISFVSKRICLL